MVNYVGFSSFLTTTIVIAAILACAFALPLDDRAYSKNKGLASMLAEQGGMVPLGGRIVGGDAVPITQFPWIVSMLRLGSHRCGAAIISATRTLSAAHCTVGIPGNGFSVRAGSTTNNAGGQTRTTSNVINHPQYNAQTLNNDICVMILSSALTGATGVAIIGMPAQGAGPATGATAWVAGWGATCEGCAGTTSLRAVSKPIVANANCNTMYGGGITAQMLCAGFPAGGRDACQGDSGGPLTVGNVLHGVVSWGRGCARPNLPGVYARVGSFRTWINGHM